jgi:uncharacterized alpha-E superfamily protein
MMLSRVADALYWIGRYLERAEHGCRLLDLAMAAAMEGGRDEAGDIAQRALQALGAPPLIALNAPADEVRRLTFDRAEPSSVIASITFARENARQVREQITTEMWERLNLLYLRVRDGATDPDGAFRSGMFYHDAISDLHALKGIVDGTMNHGEGWRFLQLGRSLERATLIARLLDLHLAPASGPTGEYGWIVLLRMCCALEPYLRVHTADFRRERVAAFLVLDPEFPRALRYCTGRLAEHLSSVAPGMVGPRRMSAERLAGRLRSRLAYASLDEVMIDGGHRLLRDVIEDCAAIHMSVADAFITYPLSERLPA